MKDQINNRLTEEGIPVKAAELIQYTDEAGTLKSLETVISTIKELVSDGITERLRGKTPEGLGKSVSTGFWGKPENDFETAYKLLKQVVDSDLKSKFENLKDKFWKIKEKIEDFKTSIMNKYKWEIKNVLALKSEKQEKQVKVLGFMQDSGFDLIPKEISDRFIWQMQWNTLNVPWLDLDVKNINLKNGNFGESVLYKDDCLNIHAKTNMLKFMNKMISWDINQPLNVEAIANGSEKVNPSSLQNKFLEAWIVDNLGWKEWKISENLSKSDSPKTA